MLLDQISLLTAIGFSSAALMLTLLVSWLGSRSDNYLLSWACGLALIVPGVIVFGYVGAHYDPHLQLLSFALLLGGFAMVYAGAQQFHTGKVSWLPILALWGLFTGGISILFALGVSGLATVGANVGIAVLVALSAYQSWAGRAEAPVPLIVNAILYAAISLSFVLCGVALLTQGDFVLTARPENWAEDLNSIAAIIGLTGIGALSITLNQSRAARHHRRNP